MPVSCERCVLFGRGLCDGPITRPEEFYRLWCVTSRMRKHWPALGCCTRRATTTFLREAEDLQRWDMQLQQQIYNLGTRTHIHTHTHLCLSSRIITNTMLHISVTHKRKCKDRYRFFVHATTVSPAIRHTLANVTSGCHGCTRLRSCKEQPLDTPGRIIS